ncbi:hypothetical protein EIP91_005496 [Steccherinum ochraceum]|uniref:Uncharacterized protein n=1 Tax=Steccherinum ochraceum TaxID=92696 RepID=A0A4R0RS25_9APHY|nr:hypothetical protein EIP91_005496 [Steccherinum ochraceum]
MFSFSFLPFAPALAETRLNKRLPSLTMLGPSPPPHVSASKDHALWLEHSVMLAFMWLDFIIFGLFVSLVIYLYPTACNIASSMKLKCCTAVRNMNDSVANFCYRHFGPGLDDTRFPEGPIRLEDRTVYHNSTFVPHERIWITWFEDVIADPIREPPVLPASVEETLKPGDIYMHLPRGVSTAVRTLWLLDHNEWTPVRTGAPHPTAQGFELSMDGTSPTWVRRAAIGDHPPDYTD